MKANKRKASSEAQIKLGAVVKEYRHHLGLTQDELGWRSNLHRTYIADVERGARNVTLRSILNLAKALEITVGHMLSRATGPSAKGSDSRDYNGLDVPGVLLVENNASDAAITVRSFGRARITNRVRIARDAEEAISILFDAEGDAKRRAAQFQLILLGLNLPRMSGLDLLRRIKSDKRTRNIPVVILTVSSSDHMIIECGRLGAQNYIIKPFGVESLIRIAPKLDLQLTLARPLV